MSHQDAVQCLSSCGDELVLKVSTRRYIVRFVELLDGFFTSFSFMKISDFVNCNLLKSVFCLHWLRHL